MRKYKKEILSLTFIGILILVGFGAWQTAGAADPLIYASPVQLSKKAGEIFDISVKVNPEGQKVCAVEGKINLSKLSCQKIVMGKGISVQTSPSCDNLNFLIGIQGCATQDKTLFTVTVKAESLGTAAANFSDVDIIGEGASISSAFSKGVYTLTSSKKKIVSETKKEIVPPKKVVQIQKKKIIPAEKITPKKEIIPKKVVAEKSSQKTLSDKEQKETSAKKMIARKGLLAAIGFTSFNWKLILIIIGIIAVGLIAFWLIKKKRIKKLLK